MEHESVYKDKTKSGDAMSLNPLKLGKGMVSMVGNTVGNTKTTKEYLLESRTAAHNKKERLISLGVEKEESNAGAMLMGGMMSMAEKTKSATKNVGGGLVNLN